MHEFPKYVYRQTDPKIAPKLVKDPIEEEKAFAEGYGQFPWSAEPVERNTVEEAPEPVSSEPKPADFPRNVHHQLLATVPERFVKTAEEFAALGEDWGFFPWSKERHEALMAKKQADADAKAKADADAKAKADADAKVKADADAKAKADADAKAKADADKKPPASPASPATPSSAPAPAETPAPATEAPASDAKATGKGKKAATTAASPAPVAVGVAEAAASPAAA
jgi:hypothetical protein